MSSPPSQSLPSPTLPESELTHHENPTSSPPPQESKNPDPNHHSLLKIDEKTPIPATPPESSPENRGDPSSSPLRHDGKPIPPLPLPSPPKNTPINPATPTAETAAAAAVISVSAIAIASRFSRDELELDLGAVGKAKKVGKGGVSVTRRRRVRRIGAGEFVVVVGRVSAAVLCLVALAVMAADKTEGWAGDSFDRYIEFRYLIGINAISFAYSSFQIFLEVHYLVTDKHIIGFPVRYLVDLSMDQILAYLLMSASSAAASRNDVWVSRFGSDSFTKMADGSIAVSFLAFLALALSSVFSARNLFRWKS